MIQENRQSVCKFHSEITRIRVFLRRSVDLRGIFHGLRGVFALRAIENGSARPHDIRQDSPRLTPTVAVTRLLVRSAFKHHLPSAPKPYSDFPSPEPNNLDEIPEPPPTAGAGRKSHHRSAISGTDTLKVQSARRARVVSQGTMAFPLLYLNRRN